MATPIIPDGIYNISSAVAPKFRVDLYKNRSLGAITSWQSNGGLGQMWNVTNIGDNQIVLQSYDNTHTYAGAYNKTEGSAIRGTPNGTTWTVESADDYRVLKAGADAADVGWLITGQDDGAAIVLDDLGDPTKAEAKWKFTPVVDLPIAP